MLENPLYSIRMRAAEGGPHEQGGRHISGGERLARESEVQLLVAELLTKSMGHSRGNADFIQVVVEKMPYAEVYVPPLPVATEGGHQVDVCRAKALNLLVESGVSRAAAELGLNELQQSEDLRGAIIMDAVTGTRLDKREQKGVRVSRMDWDASSHEEWVKIHVPLGSLRVREALALATKVAYSPYTLAELCWSDDPDYVTGYVASDKLGYRRIPHLKKLGESTGGRVFFVQPGLDVDEYIHYLEKTPIWIGWEGGRP
ncbi:6-carboxyhexanoate--CoA ligase [Ammoniphilus sp. CFH 90114]|uniref:6-carboxyhexanoate--CoA ligase n=1 Tax=Ammoniphilus sp. CFH 90114 TaxID=2493665 RepID=UPI00100EC94E|nr:6-carboxyhexanoate--CoA ligase [Ammoniphilus sp. CFH 90114]RXT06992.1 6-carboxyhexanoate--CoA ligase [Ammoniphilus sp. CFH 90114]